MLMRLWGRHEALILALGGVVAAVLGYLGLELAQETKPESFLDSIYRILRLFVVDGGALPRGDLPLPLNVARFLAPLIAGWAVVRALVALFHDRLRLVAAGLLRDHVVVAGLGPKGFALARAYRDEGVPVVVVERDPNNPETAGARERGARVLHGDPADAAILRRVRIQRAQLLVAATDNDGANLDVALAASRLARARNRGTLTALVHLDNLPLQRSLRLPLAARSFPAGFRLELFNLLERAARPLLEEHPAFGPDGFEATDRPLRLVLVGFGGPAENLVLEAAQAWRARTPGRDERLELRLVGPTAAHDREAMRARYPELDGICDIEIRTADLGSRELEGAVLAGALEGQDAVYVCLDDEGIALAAVLSLRPGASTLGIPLVLVLEQVGSAEAVLGGAGQTSVRIFGLLERTLSPDLLLHGSTEIVARAAHEEYVRRERRKGATALENPSTVPWVRLPEELKKSNRWFADSIVPLLDAKRAGLVPAPLLDPDRARLPFSDEEIEALARMEHDRWWRDLRRDGWRRGPVRDPARKLHPDLRPWEVLNEEAKEKDRGQVRALPAILARVGLEIRRL